MKLNTLRVESLSAREVLGVSPSPSREMVAVRLTRVYGPEVGTGT